MKKLILTLIVLLTTMSCKAQLNNLNDTELFEGIKFNNITLGAIMESSGNLNTMKTYFGNDIQEQPNNSAPFLAKNLSNNNFSFGFEDETDTGNNYDLTSIYVLNSSVVVNVKGLSIRIGDHKSKFGSFLFNTTDSSYNFTDADTGSVGLSFKIDPVTNKVSEISFIAF